MRFVPWFLLSFKYSCKYSFFDSLLIFHIILILFSEYFDVNKSILDGSYTATIFFKTNLFTFNADLVRHVDAFLYIEEFVRV